MKRSIFIHPAIAKQRYQEKIARSTVNSAHFLVVLGTCHIGGIHRNRHTPTVTEAFWSCEPLSRFREKSGCSLAVLQSANPGRSTRLAQPSLNAVEAIEHGWRWRTRNLQYNRPVSGSSSCKFRLLPISPTSLPTLSILFIALLPRYSLATSSSYQY